MNRTASRPLLHQLIMARAIIALGRLWPMRRGKNRLFSTLVTDKSWQSAFAGVMPVIRTKAGFFLHGSAVDYTSDWIRVFGDHEISTQRFIDDHARAGSVMLDIGSNIGYFSFYSAMVKGTRSVAFEPNPAVTQLLAQSISRNAAAERVRVIETALGDNDQSAKLIPDETKADLGGVRIEADAAGGIQVRRLDSIEATDGRFEGVSVVKIDVEGWELSVIAGMKNFLARERPALAVEDLSQNYEVAGLRGGELAGILSEFGYEEDVTYRAFDQFPSNRFFLAKGSR